MELQYALTHTCTLRHTQTHTGPGLLLLEECSLAFSSAAHVKTTHPWLHSVQIPLLGERFRMKNAIWDEYKSHWITETWTSVCKLDDQGMRCMQQSAHSWGSGTTQRRGGERGGEVTMRGIHVYLWLTHVDV